MISFSPLASAAPAAGLQGGQRPPGVAARDAQQMRLGVLGQGDRAAEAALVGRARAAAGARRSSSVSDSRVSSSERDSSGEMIEKYGFSVVAAISVTQRFSTAGQQRVLLGLAEAVDLVEEEDGLLAVAAGGAAGALDDGPDLLDARGDRGELDEALVGGLADHVRQGRLAGAGRAPEDHRRRAGGAAAALADEAAQRRARLQQMLLADDLVEGARAHPDSEGAAGRVLLLAVFGGCGKEVGLHVWKPMSRH